MFGKAGRWGLLIGLLGLVALAVWALRPKPIAVELASVERKALVQALDEDGVVRSQVEIQLAPSIGGRLKRILVPRGSRVRTGQLLAELDLSETEAAVEQLSAQEQAARHAVQQARAQWQLTRQRTAAEMEMAAAALAVSQAQRQRLEGGVRPEQIRALETALARSRIRAAETQRDLRRRQELFANGAVSRSDLEAFQSAARNAQLQLQESEQRLLEARRGPVLSERRVVRAEEQRARAGYRSAAAQTAQTEVALAALAEAEQRLAAVRAQLKQAQVKLEHGRLRAPRPGVVEWEELQPGEMVNPGQTVLRLVDPQAIYVELLLDEGDRAQARLGASVTVSSDAYPGREFQGKLEAIEAQAYLKRQLRNTPTQDEDRVFRSRVRVEQASGKLFPGMSVFAQVVLNRRDQVLVVPRQACINREGEWIVYRYQNGRAERRVIETGQKDSAQIEVLKGLEAGDQVVLNPGTLQDGAPLQVQSRHGEAARASLPRSSP